MGLMRPRLVEGLDNALRLFGAMCCLGLGECPDSGFLSWANTAGVN